MKKFILVGVLAAVAAFAFIFFQFPKSAKGPALTETLVITFRLPDGYELTPGAPFELTWQTENSKKELTALVKDKMFNPLAAPYNLKFTSAADSQALILHARLYYCQKTSRMCFQDDFKTRVPLVSGKAPASWVWEIKPVQTKDGRLQTADQKTGTDRRLQTVV